MEWVIILSFAFLFLRFVLDAIFFLDELMLPKIICNAVTIISKFWFQLCIKAIIFMVWSGEKR